MTQLETRCCAASPLPQYHHSSCLPTATWHMNSVDGALDLCVWRAATCKHTCNGWAVLQPCGRDPGGTGSLYHGFHFHLLVLYLFFFFLGRLFTLSPSQPCPSTSLPQFLFVFVPFIWYAYNPQKCWRRQRSSISAAVLCICCRAL